jgi:hypothetical protein
MKNASWHTLSMLLATSALCSAAGTAADDLITELPGSEVRLHVEDGQEVIMVSYLLLYPTGNAVFRAWSCPTCTRVI